MSAPRTHTASASQRGEVWVWLPRDRDGMLAGTLGELLYEAGALARRLDAALVAVGDRSPTPDELAVLAPWGLQAMRALGAALPPHPACPGGRSPLWPLVEAARAEGMTVRAVLLPADSLGRVVAPLLAAELGAACVTHAEGVTGDGRHFAVSRATLGGQYEALVRLPLGRPLVVTLHSGAVGEVMPPTGSGAAPAVAALSGSGDAPAAPAPALHSPDPDTLDIADAERIVAFGRGAFTPEGVALAQRLARALGATLAGTRPAADEGWLPFARQVGLTGAIVQPRLYVALGISGAPYHMVGVKEPETLIAVNSDPEAPILAQAHLGIVGDLYTVVPALLARLERGEPLVPGEASAPAQGGRS